MKQDVKHVDANLYIFDNGFSTLENFWHICIMMHIFSKPIMGPVRLAPDTVAFLLAISSLEEEYTNVSH